jgi:hypothetical protein
MDTMSSMTLETEILIMSMIDVVSLLQDVLLHVE